MWAERKKEFRQALDQGNKTLHFIQKNKEDYFSFSPEIKKEILNQLAEDMMEYVEKLEIRELVEYNPVGYQEGTVECCTSDYIKDYQVLIDSLDIGNIEDAEKYVEKFKFYCIEIEFKKRKMIFFRRVTKFKKLTSSGILAAFQGNQINKVEDKLLGLDGTVDVIAYDEKMYILNHTGFERIFVLNDHFEEKAIEALKVIKGIDKIQNFSSFEEDCLNNIHVKKMLTKMGSDMNMEKCFDQFDRIKETIGIFDLEIEVDQMDKMIIYEDKSQIVDILRIINDAYYISCIMQAPGVDNKI